MKSILVKLLSSKLVLVIGILLFTTNTSANIETGWSGSIAGGIPAITRDSVTNEAFWCNQEDLLHKKCRVVDISPSKRVAIVNGTIASKTCPNGLWGVVDRLSGESITLYPGKKISFDDYCRGNFKVGFVKPHKANSLADIVMYFNDSPVDSLEYLTE